MCSLGVTKNMCATTKSKAAGVIDYAPSMSEKPNATHPRSPEAYGSAALVSLSVPQTSTGHMWAWRRDVRTSPEIEEFNNLVSLISNLHLTNDEDSWDCIIDHTRKFLVKAMRVHIASIPHSRAYGDSEITLSSPTSGLAKTSCSMTSTFCLSTGSSELFIHNPELSVSPLKSKPAADSD
nr:RNA-directed DNA polymerase, eukaryota, reverse transcriptase zinc-binding domain protein [Tanacetum cinerariifolium]